MKKSLLIAAALRLIAASALAQTPAQPWGPVPNPPVIDITNLIHAVENGMEMFEQLTGMYQTIKTNIERLQDQIKAFESFDPRQLSLLDPLGSWRRIMTYGNRMMTYEENIESILNRKDIKIGSASYSLADLYSANPVTNITNMAGSAMDYAIADPFEKQLTPEEKAVFHQKYGMSYGNYIRCHRIGEGLSKKAAEVTAYNRKLQEELTADREAIQAMLEEQGDGSWVREQQKVNSLLMAKNQELKTKTKLIADIAAMYANAAAGEKTDMEARQKINDADFGENYLKILEKTGKKNDYMGHLYPIN
ncbi:MAG: hypothetical protein LBU85_09840 [Treponema sp.]|jgi:hypothetical protein|nr:hypothetical protein [Treponema sp.]